MIASSRTIYGVRVPAFLYGTAWKEEETERLTRLALEAGFRGIDTANQRRHYHEAGVGKAVAAVLNQGELSRDDLFLQTKFTHVAGQDHRLPYDPRAPLAEQVRQSFQSSLEHLRVSRVDSYILHGPSHPHSFADADWEVWGAMESIHREGKAGLLGVSNVHPGQLEELQAGARVKPAFVQNRCFARNRWDGEIRDFCAGHGIAYQGFSLLTANRREQASPVLAALSARLGRGIPEIIFRFALQVGMIPLTGTTDPGHMRHDLNCFEIDLTSEDVAAIESVAG